MRELRASLQRVEREERRRDVLGAAIAGLTADRKRCAPCGVRGSAPIPDPTEPAPIDPLGPTYREGTPRSPAAERNTRSPDGRCPCCEASQESIEGCKSPRKDRRLQLGHRAW